MVKFLVIGDLHGRKPVIRIKDFDAIIQIGDVCDDRKIGKLWKGYFAFLKKIGHKTGLKNEVSFEDYIKKDRKVSRKKFKQWEKESLQRGRELMVFLNSFNKPVFFIPGNWDQSYGKSNIKNIEKNNYVYRKAFLEWYLGKKSNSKLLKGLRNVIDCQHKLRKFQNTNIIGLGLESGSFDISRKKKIEDVTPKQLEILKKLQRKLETRLENLFKEAKKNKNPTIFLSHNTPFGTKLDIIKNKKSIAYKKHVGSKTAKKFCKKYQPLICLSGHVHEGKGKDKIKNTSVVNAGYGKDALVLLEIDDKTKKIKKVKFL